LLAYVESQGPLGVVDLGTCDRRLITRSPQPPLPLVAALEQVPDPNIELLSLIQILRGEILRAEKWDELAIGPENSIGAQVGGNLLG
jgi:hypothetical protein